MSDRPHREYYDVSICAIVKNEGMRILDWIAYHRLIGVRGFFLYDNNSTDGLVELLGPLISHKLVHLTDWPINPGQIEAYVNHIHTSGDRSRWTAFIDVDEYINVLSGEQLPQWLSRRAHGRSVALQWLNFGPNGHVEPPAMVEIGAYTARLPADSAVNGHVKTIVWNDEFIAPITPHAFRTRQPVLDERGRPVDMSTGDYSIQAPQVHNEICINHYYTRSRAEWTAKVARGMADSAANAPNRRALSWFEDYERAATVRDRRITVWRERVSHEVQRLLALD